MSRRPLAASVSAAAVAGWIGGALAWALASSVSALPNAMHGYGRLDQAVAFVIGACVGVCVCAMYARHRREAMGLPTLAGFVLGGVAATLGATLGLLVSRGTSPTAFVVGRVVTWALMCAGTAAALALSMRSRHAARALESAVIAGIGGIAAGAIVSFPGPTELWWPVAITMAGAIVGLAAIGPSVWRAPIVVQVLSSRDQRPSLWSLHECAIESGWSMPIGEAQVGCLEGVVTVYPPPAGAVLDGYPLYRAMPLTRDAVLGVGRLRARLVVRGRA